MTEQTYRLLLLACEETKYYLIENYLCQLNKKKKFHYQLEWKQIATQEYLFLEEYDLYLVDAQVLPSLNSQVITLLSKQFKSAPIIILTNSYEVGIAAVEAGATDYLDISQLTLPALERSLRLSLAYNQVHYQRSSTEERLRASEALYTSIFNHSAEGIFLLNLLPNGQLVYETVNPTYEQIAGMTREEVVGKTIAEVAPLEIANLLERQYRACITAKKPLRYEHTIELKGNTRIWRTVIVPIANNQGQITKLQGSARDITHEKKAIAIAIRQTRYRNLLRSVTLKIHQSLNIDEILQTTVTELHKTINADRVLLFQFLPDGSGKTIKESVLPGFSSMLGEVTIDEYCRDELPKKYFEGYVYSCEDSDRASLSPCHREFLQKYQIRANLVIPIFRRLSSQTHSKNQENYLWGLLCVQQCRNTRRWTEDEIELLQQLVGQLNIALSQAELLASEIKQRKELARSNADLEQFAYIASHDLQAPLQTISNYAQLLERRYRGKLDEKADKYFHYILDGVRSMRTQINDLLEYSRVGKQKSTFRSTDCNLVVKGAIANLRSEIEKNQVIITFENNLPTLIADFSQLVVLFQNLFSNSIKYRSEERLLIKVSATYQQDCWQFAVSDNGIGIEPQYQQRIFKIFQRLHTQEEYPGNGIGLAICQKIVECHGGKIWIESNLGDGATFCFTLPVKSHS
jgi:PAS domain S-box-containing protein